MPKLRFTADQPHDVPLVGRIVSPDDLVEVPQDVFAAHSWPDTQWSVVDSGAKSARKDTEGADK